MKLISQIHKTCLVPVLVLAVMLAFLLTKGVEAAYTIPFMEVEIAEEADGSVVLYAVGGNMLRVNSFYVGGKRIEGCEVNRETYNRCCIKLDTSVFSRGNTWYELRVGYSKWGCIDLLSSPVWIEWTGS